MYQATTYYLRWYRDFFLDWWADMGPAEYGTLLIGIGVFGWLLMKSGGRR